MPQSLSSWLRKHCVKVIYWYSLGLGLLPAPYNWKSQKFQYSRSYLCYSLVIQFVFIAITPLGAPFSASSEEQKQSYMYGQILLEFTYYIGKIARVLANFVICVEIWLKRRQILDLFEKYQMFESRYERFFKQCSLETQMQDELDRVNRDTICKLFTGQLNLFVIVTLYMRMQELHGTWFILMVITNYMQAHHLMTANMYFVMVLSQMHLHFAYINKSLETMMSDQFSQKRINCCWMLFNMHFECYQMSLNIFTISRSVTLFTLIKVFTSNIIIFYHAVLFINRNIKSNLGDDFVGTLSIVCIYWDTILIMKAISKLQTSCNRTGEILRQFSCHPEEEEVEECLSTEFTKMLSQFHNYLACHKLKFYIFGMFSLNKDTCLQYFVSALVHLIILMQYDLKLRAST